MKYILSTEPKEILKIIRQSDAEDECIVWQSTSEQRVVQIIEEVRVDNVRKVIRFKLKKDSFAELDPALTVYVKLAFRNTIFKGELIGNKENLIFVNVPDEIQFQELREFPRFSFGANEDKSITLGVESQITSNSMFNLKVRLQDISQTGIGFLVSHSNQELLLTNDVMMTSMGTLDLQTNIPTEIVYSDSFAYRENGKRISCLKMGAKFGYHLDENLLNKFVRSVEGFDHSQIGFLGHEYEFQNSLHYQIDTMLKHLIKKNDLFQSIEQIEEVAKAIKEDEYFPKHIRLLAKISCGIAKLVGNDSGKVYQKLIYASFVHDIAFYANPKLALIKNIEHLEQAKAELTADEIELFKKSPKIAFDFAFYDKFAPKGVETILIQAKELPDGNGYPNCLSKEKIHPLAAIFIVAHDLTDYALEHKSWNYYDYLTHYVNRFKGGIFDEIYHYIEKARETA